MGFAGGGEDMEKRRTFGLRGESGGRVGEEESGDGAVG